MPGHCEAGGFQVTITAVEEARMDVRLGTTTWTTRPRNPTSSNRYADHASRPREAFDAAEAAAMRPLEHRARQQHIAVEDRRRKLELVVQTSRAKSKRGRNG